MKSVNDETNKLPSTHIIKERWSKLLNEQNGEPNAEDHLYYILLRAVVAKYPDTPQVIAERIMEAFPPVSNKTKISFGGRRPWDTPKSLLARLTYVSFAGKHYVSPKLGVDEFTHKKVIELGSKVKLYV
jgi:hypothetical protein